MYPDGEAFFAALHHAASVKNVSFQGQYTMAVDPLVTDKIQVQMTVLEVWKVTGYRFTYVILKLILKLVLNILQCQG